MLWLQPSVCNSLFSTSITFRQEGLCLLVFMTVVPNPVIIFFIFDFSSYSFDFSLPLFCGKRSFKTVVKVINYLIILFSGLYCWWQKGSTSFRCIAAQIGQTGFVLTLPPPPWLSSCAVFDSFSPLLVSFSSLAPYYIHTSDHCFLLVVRHNAGREAKGREAK